VARSRGRRGRGRRKSPKTLNFKSKKAYQKWLSYNWIHNRKKMGRPPHKKVKIRGKPHKVKH